MAGKAAKVLKVATGVVAGIAAGAGVYRAGKRAGAEKSYAAESASDAPVQGVAQPTPKAMPRPGMKVPSEEVPRIVHDRKAYHSLINERANDLRARIAEQAYASVLQGESEVDGQVQANAVEVNEDAPIAEGEEPSEPGIENETPSDAAEYVADSASNYEDEPEPYEQIQDALKTSKLFAEEGEEAYKPTPFSMPKS